MREAPPVPILMYHSVDEECSPKFRRWMVTPRLFEDHMGALAAAGYHPITVSALARLYTHGVAPPDDTVLLTFDDGFEDFRTGAMPVLRRYGFAATLYVVSGYVGKTSRWLAAVGEGGRRMLTWSDLREISDLGIECGAHTHTHPQLDVLPPQAALSEIRYSKLILEDGLGVAVKSFAYPHGYASRTTRRLVRESGFTSACRVRHALSSAKEDAFRLSRIIVTGDMPAHTLQTLLRGARLSVAPRDRLGTGAWRLVRKAARSTGLVRHPVIACLRGSRQARASGKREVHD